MDHIWHRVFLGETKPTSQIVTTPTQDRIHLSLHKRNAHLTIMGVLTRALYDMCLGNSTYLQDAAK